MIMRVQPVGTALSGPLVARSSIWVSGMEWAVPANSREEVNDAAKVWHSSSDIDKFFEAYLVMDNWRASHNYPLNTFQVTLRYRARSISQGCLVTQRLKRFSSIMSKLRREPLMKLSQMQDIGGCRVVLNTTNQVDHLVRLYFDQKKLKHYLTHSDDYIMAPRESGYRSVHLIYKFRNDNRPAWNELKIEIQIRTALQHAWATAVETVDAFTKYALKSSQGPEEWKRFFALMGSVLALRVACPLVPETPTRKRELIRELRHCVYELDVINKLETYGQTIQGVVTVPPKGGGRRHYLLLEMDTHARQTTIRGFTKEEAHEASTAYTDLERSLGENPSTNAVLVSVQKIGQLRRAYPNYFMDTQLFVAALNVALRR